MKKPTLLAALVGIIPLLAAAILLTAGPAAAASLQEVTNFGTNQSQLRMYVYKPDRVAARPPIVVAVHYCHGDGPAFFNGSDFGRLADQYGFIVIFPSVTQASDQCFDVATSATLTHNGGSDSLGIVSMVRYALQAYNGDPDRVYATGVSSGAMMTNVLLGAYPDVFKAGSAFAGVPFGCFAVHPDALRWSDDCAKGRVTHTAQEWGGIVRNAYPGYTGPRPRVQLWHGTNDEVLNYVNFGEAIKQWTNVLGVGQTPVTTEANTPQSGWTRTRYGAAGEAASVEAVSMSGVSHNLPVQAAAAIHFFGLDGTGSSSGGGSSSSSSSRSSSSSSRSSSSSSSSFSSRSSSSSSSSSGGGTGSCSAAYTVASSWSTGFVGSVKVTAGSSAITGWAVALGLPAGASIVNIWNGQRSADSGSVQVTNLAYNGAVGAGQSTEFGFQATGSGAGATVSCTAR